MTRRAGTLAAMLCIPLVLSPRTARTAPASPEPAAGTPVAGYARHLLRPAAAGPMPDLVLCRTADRRCRRFDFRPDGMRDAAGIAAFLARGTGRVARVFDQFGGRDLVPRPGTRGPLMVADGEPDGLAGLRLDNGGAFEGVRTGPGDPYYAVSLSAVLPDIDLRRGVSMLAAMRLGNVSSIAGGTLWGLEGASPFPLLLMAGNADPARPEAEADDVSLLYGRSLVLAPPPPSTPSVLAAAIDGTGFSALSGDSLRREAVTLPTNRSWNRLTVGTTDPGAGAGFQLDGFVVFASRLPDPQLVRWAARLRAPGPPDGTRIGAGGTLVLDGSSVEAGVGSSALRNLSRRYKGALPGMTIHDVAVGGARTADRLRALPGTLALFDGAAGPRVLLCGIGANSIATGLSPAEAYAQIAAYVRLAHRAVPGLLVGLATLIPNGLVIAAGRGGTFAAYNALLRANGAGADFVSDRAADPVMGDPARYRPIDPRISRDGGHPTDEGYARLAAIDLAAIEGALRRSRSAARDQAAAASTQRRR